MDSQRTAAERALLGAVLLDPAGQEQVLDGVRGIRQRLWVAGSRVSQAASSGDLPSALHQVAEAGREVRACRARWARLPEPWRRELPWPVRGRRASLDVAHRGQACGWGAERPRGPVAEAAGIRLLRDLAAAPGQIARVRDWLRPEHFATRRHGEVYALMRDMDAAGMPVDPVTVGREAARRWLRLRHTELAGGTGVFAQASARDLYAMGVLAQIGRAGAGVQADAAGTRRSMSALLDAAGDRVRCPDDRWPAEPWCRAQPEPGPPREPARAPGPGTRTGDAAISRGQPRQPEREAVR